LFETDGKRVLLHISRQKHTRTAAGAGWRPGNRLRRLARARTTTLDPAEVVQPLLHQLGYATGETACLHLLDGGTALLVAGAESSAHALRRVTAIGERTPLTRGSAGIAILAQLETASRERLLAGLSPNARSKLRKRLAWTAERGWCESAGENHPGVAGIAAAVSAGPGGPVIGSITLAGPANRWNEAARHQAAALLTSACQEATRQLSP
jgi:DNA-binding IclR family transcriptional regulator